MKVGIPRGLLYYQYYPLWRTFFEKLGAEVVVSASTTKRTLAEGASRVVADTCLPAKVFLGHVLDLVGKCDYLFIPVIRSVKNKVYNCSKFLGLPDMTRAVIPEAPPILDTEIDVNKGTRKLEQAIYQLGHYFTQSSSRIREAAYSAWQAHENYRELMCQQKLTPMLALESIKDVSSDRPNEPRATIALIGHPYLLYDEHVNHRLIHRLEQAGNRVVTPEMLTSQEKETAISKIMGQPYWTYEEEVVGAGGHFLEKGADGVIGLMAFGCGPDSLMMDMVRRQAARLGNTPFMSLTLEEHTAEAGVVTRLEAFLDMLQRRKKRQADKCG